MWIEDVVFAPQKSITALGGSVFGVGVFAMVSGAG